MEKQQNTREVTQAYQEFMEYAKKNQVPDKIKDKLVVLAKLIFNEPYHAVNHSSLDDDEIKQLEAIEPEYKIKLFLSVCNCIIGKEDVDFVNQRQASIKKDSFWSSWMNCYITYNDDTLTISKKSQKEEMPFSNLKVSGSTKKSGKKYCFTIQYRDSRFRIAFDNDSIAQQYRQKIKSLISAKLKSKKSATTEDLDKTEKEFSNVLSEQDSESDKDFLEEFDVENIENEANFKVISNTDNGRIMAHKDSPNRFKSFMVLECSDPSLALESYMKAEEWNQEIAEAKIINRTEQNCYVIYECYKAPSYLTRPRDFVLLKIGLKKKNRYLLLQKSVTHPNHPPYKIVVRGNVKKKVTAFIPHATNNKLMLLISEIEVDFGGYNSVDNNKSLAIKFFESYYNLSKYLIQKSFTPLSQRLFDFQTRHHFDKVIYQAMKPNDPPEDVTKEEKPKVCLIKDFMSVLPKDEYTVITDKYIELIRANVHHYYNINHRYHLGFSADKILPHVTNDKVDTVFCGDWKFHENGDVEFINMKTIEAQKDVIKYILKQIGTNFLKGKSIMNMSLPVDIFDDKSLLERSAGSFGYAPILLGKAGESKDEVEQITLSTIFISTISTLQIKLVKPFNPILGETFQGYLGGIPIFYEQISHHPPVSAFYMETETYKFYGSLDVKVDMGLNTAVGYSLGLIHIVFKSTNLHLEGSRPAIELSGISFGARKHKLIHRIALMSKESKLYSEISFGKDKKDLYMSKSKMKPNEMMGGIFRVSQESLNRLHQQVKKELKFSGISKKDVIEKLGEISGSWNGSICVDGEVQFRINEPVPFQVTYEDFPLASDSNFREDVLYRRMGNLAEAQISKEKFENIQRQDRKLRGNKH